MLTVRQETAAVALFKSITTKFNQEVVETNEFFLLECIKECHGSEEKTKVHILTEMNSFLQLQFDTLAFLAEWLKQRKEDYYRGGMLTIV